MTTITIASIETGPKKSKVVTTEGRRLGCFNDKLAKWGIEQGASYNVETIDNDFGTNIVSAKRVAGASAAPVTAKTNGNGHYRPTAPEDAERMFVCATLTALIKAGEVKNDKTQLFHTTNMLRALWQHTFGNGGTFQASEADHSKAA